MFLVILISEQAKVECLIHKAQTWKVNCILNAASLSLTFILLQIWKITKNYRKIRICILKSMTDITNITRKYSDSAQHVRGEDQLLLNLIVWSLLVILFYLFTSIKRYKLMCCVREKVKHWVILIEFATICCSLFFVFQTKYGYFFLVK